MTSIWYVFFQAVAGEHAFAAFAGDDGCKAARLEPPEEAAKLGTQYRFVVEAGEQGLQAIEEHAVGAD
jgi:hypothetical protein